MLDDWSMHARMCLAFFALVHSLTLFFSVQFSTVVDIVDILKDHDKIEESSLEMPIQLLGGSSDTDFITMHESIIKKLQSKYGAPESTMSMWLWYIYLIESVLLWLLWLNDHGGDDYDYCDCNISWYMVLMDFQWSIQHNDNALVAMAMCTMIQTIQSVFIVMMLMDFQLQQQCFISHVGRNGFMTLLHRNHYSDYYNSLLIVAEWQILKSDTVFYRT